ncbi:acetate kinase [Sphingomonas sp. RT2P30]|uniref:acetate/propionate family kinase n=1 Tax=Parasphingomonas halimpatiens TaxID=3096162 RepID=UPI002FC77287
MDDREIMLTLNSGSSSLKFGLYDAGPAEVVELVAGEIEAPAYDDAAFDQIERILANAKAPSPTAIGHRIVHGGAELRWHTRINLGVMAQLEGAVAFAPVHGPASLALIRLAQARHPVLQQVACFDTAFHATMPDLAAVLPIPRMLRDEGVRRYGFHGLSCESIVRQLGHDLPDKLIIAHLGNGASVTAVKAGRSIDTSMGLTPSGGVIMGSRAGDIDPGVLLYLMREKHWFAAQLEDMIDRRSGMLGISEISGDMRRLHEARTSQPDADLAIRMFCRSTAKQIAAMMTTLGGASAIVFTGGIGEHDEVVQAAICGELSWAGVTVGSRGQGCRAFSLPSKEDEQIALHVRDLQAAAGASTHRVGG